MGRELNKQGEENPLSTVGVGPCRIRSVHFILLLALEANVRS